MNGSLWQRLLPLSRRRGPIATLALFFLIASGFALVRASAGERFASFHWPESLSTVFGSRSARTLTPTPPVSGTKTICPSGCDYATLTAAISDINTNGGATGAILFELQSTYVSTSETFPINPKINGASASNTITIRPAIGATNLLIQTSATQAFNLDGATFVTIDGRPGGTGAAKELTIDNASTSGQAIQFINDTTGNRVEYCTVKGVNTSSSSGVIVFSTTTGTTGNDNNTIDHNDIRDGATTPTNGIYAAGSGPGTIANSGNIISNNNIFNFFNAAGATAGINIQSGNTDWTINGNSLFQQATRTTTADSLIYGISITPGTDDNFSVSGNYIGGADASAGGAAWTVVGDFANSFVGIYLSVGTTNASNVQGNTIANMVLSSTSDASLPGAWNGIFVQSGLVNVGTTAGNTIGAGTGAGSITINYSTATTGGFSTAIASSSDSNGAISNNTIGSINLIGVTTGGAGSATNGGSFHAIYLSGSGSNTVSGNTIGSTSTANSINASGTATSSVQAVTGILSTASGATTISNNTVANLNNGYTGVNASSLTRGIAVSAGTNSITGNTISNIVSVAQHAGLSGASGPIVGISLDTASTSGQSVSQNVVHSLTGSYNFCGIFGNLSGSLTNIFSGNFVHSLNIPAPSNYVFLIGIRVKGTANLQNNMVRLGFDANGNSITYPIEFHGIFRDSGSPASTAYFNSVYIGGTGVSNEQPANTSAFTRAGAPSSGTEDIRDNIFVNARSNTSFSHGSGSNTHYAYYASAGSVSSDNNIYYVSGTDGVLAVVGTECTTLAAIRIATGGDAHSLSADPLFLAPNGTSSTLSLHITSGSSPAANSGMNIGGITTDFDGDTRNASTPDIGADEFTSAPLISKSFLTSPIVINGTSVLRIVVTNSNPDPLTGVQFTDSLPSGLTAADSSTGQCGGTLSVASNVISLSGATIAANSDCTSDITVTGTTPGLKTNITGNVTSTNGGTGNTASAQITVNDATAPTITYTAFSNTSSTADRTLSVTVTDSDSGVPTSGAGLPVIYYRKGSSGVYSSNQCSFVSSSSYNCVVNYSLVSGGSVSGGDTIQYYVAAQDSAATPNVTTNPSTGASGFTASPPAASTPTTSPNSYSILTTISGQVFTAGGLTGIGSGRKVTLLQNGTMAGSNTTDSSGNYSISGLTLASGDQLAVFIDDAAEKGATVTLSGASDLTNLNILQNSLIVRTDNGGSVNNANLLNAQGGAPDADLTAVYTVSGGDLTTANGVGLQIYFGSTYTPGSAVNVGGDWDNNGNFTHAGNAVTFNGTGAQTIKTNGVVAGKQFAGLTINKASGTATLAGNLVDSALNVTQGIFDQGASFDLASGAVTVGAGGTWTNSGTGDVTLSGDVSNSGTISFNANGTSCGGSDDILIRSSIDGTQRTWSGTGTFSLIDVDVKDQKAPAVPPPAVIVVNSGTNSTNNNGWLFVNQCTSGTYTWIGGTVGAATNWTVSTNWNPTRVTPATPDVLIFDGSSTPSPTVTNVPTQTIAALRLTNSVNGVTLNASGTNTLTISGGTGTDLDIPNGTLLTLAGANALTISLTGSGHQCTVAGQIIFQDTAHRLLGSNAGEITMTGANAFTTTTGFTGNPFGTGTDGSVVFQSGATGTFNSGSDPFGGSGHAVATFNSGSTARFGSDTAFAFDGRAYGNLILGGTDDYVGSGSNQTTVLDNFIIESGSTLMLSGSAGGDLNLQGNFEDQNTTPGTFNANGRAVKFQGGSTTQTILKAGSNAVSFFDVFIAETLGGKVQLLSPVAINGQLNLSTADSQLELNAKTLTLNGTVTGLGNLKGDAAATLSLGGTGSLGTLKFVTGSQTLSQMTMNRTSSGSVTLGNDLLVDDQLDLTNGIVDMGAFTLTINGAVSRTNGWIIGNEQRARTCSAGPGCVMVFDVGTANGYSPVNESLDLSQAGTYTQTAKAVQSQHPNISGGNALQRYWTLNAPFGPGGATADMTFNYLAGDVVGTEANYKLFRYSGGFTQITPDTLDTINHFATKNGVSTFSDWTLGEPSALFAAEPTVQAANVNFTDVQQNSMTVNWTNGNGATRIVLQNTVPITGVPVDGTSYTAGVSQISGDKVVYVGSGNSFNTGNTLKGGTTYYFAVFEFNGSSETENYLTTNPTLGNQATPVATFTWTGAADTDYQNSANWTPARTDTIKSTSDLIVFSDGLTDTVTNFPSAGETIGQLQVSNNTAVTLSTGAASTMTISGGNGPDVSVASGSQLNLSGSNGLIIALATTTTASISGNLTFDGGAHKLTSPDPGGITLQTASIFTSGAGSSGNPFGNITANSVIFASGSTFVFNGGGDFFGLSSPSGVVVFQTGSLYKHQAASPPFLGGRTYSNFEFNVAATVNTSINPAPTLDNLTVSQGTFNFNTSAGAGIDLRGNISVAMGATLNFNPSGAATLTFDGPDAQTISGAGSLSFNANQAFTLNNANGLTLQRNVTLNALLTLTSGNIDTGANTLMVSGTGSVTRTSGHIIGTLQRTFNTAGSVTFDVGTANGYSPVAVTATVGTFPSTFSVKATQGPLPGISGANKLARYWTLLNGSVGSANLTFNYLAGDVTGTVANYQFIKKSGSNISILAPTGTPTSTSATINGISSFSDWTLAESSAVQSGSLQFDSGPYTNSETNADHTFTVNVSRTGGADGTVSVDYAVTDGTATTANNDYTVSPASATLTWLPGDSANKSFNITVKGDTTYEANETINLTLSSVTGGAAIGAPNPTTLTITNDDGPSASATFTVNTTDDIDNGACLVSHCSLREAINAANALPDANTIDFNISGCPGGVCTINLTGALADLATDMTISGTGANVLIVRRDTGGDYRIFTVDSGKTVNLSGLTVTNGHLTGGVGAGIYNAGTLSLTDCAVINNSATGGGSNFGGGIKNETTGTLTVTRSEISGNSVSGGSGNNVGGGIDNSKTLTVINSTVSGNTAQGAGGGIANDGPSPSTTIYNSTIANNTGSNGGGVFATGGTVIMKSSIVANNIGGGTPDFQGSFTSQGFNLIRNTGGTSFTPDATDITGVDPKLGTLQNNGGPTQTHALLTGSPAIEKGIATAGVTTDQRGQPRVDDPNRPNASGGDGTDIGAYEDQNSCSTITISPDSPLPNGTAGAAYSQTLTPSGGTGPYAFSLTGGSLPSGVTLSSGGVVSGTPTVHGPFNFTATATDENGCAASKAYSLTIDCGAITLSPSSLPNGIVGNSYNHPLSGSGGIGPYTFAVTQGAQPTGLTLNSDGTWSGTLSAANTFNFTVTDTDSIGCTGSQSYTVVITSCPSTLTVNDTGDTSDAAPGDGICNDGSGHCTLRAAIEESNALDACSAVTIDFSLSLPATITVGSELSITRGVNLGGPGANQLSVSGNDLVRVFSVGSGAVSISALKIEHGKLLAGGSGAGIATSGGTTLSLTDCALTSNAITGGSFAGGAGLSNGGTMTITRCEISANSISAVSGNMVGGGVYNAGVLTVVNSTISGNTNSSGVAGGIFTEGGGHTLTVINSTIASNSASSGGGLRAHGAANLRNTIVGDNSATFDPDISTFGATITSYGHNLIENLGSASYASDPSDLIGQDPKLDALANYGGPTQTHRLQSNSPAIDKGDNCVFDLSCSSGNPPAALTTDQRGAGFSRKHDGDGDSTATVDIGGYEATPEIDVQGNSNSIPDGSTSPSATNDTDFGNADIGSDVTHTFTIYNTGTAALAITGISLSGTNSGDFSPGSLTPSSPILAGSSATFTVTFTPVTNGQRTAIVHIANDDANEGDYDFAIQGVGVIAPAEINVKGNGVSITDGDTGPSVTDDTDFGAAASGAGNVSHTFTIENTGGNPLNLTGSPRVQISGANGADFTVTSQPSTPVNGGGSTTFTIKFAPTGTGSRTAAVTIANDDSDENPYDFSIQGTGAPNPEIALEEPSGHDLTDGTSVDDFSNQDVGTTSSAKTFTIKNGGTSDLTIGLITIDGADSGDFSLDITGMSPTVAPGGSTDFKVTFTPGAIGSRSATLHIANNDSDEDPFDVGLTGTGTASATLIVTKTEDSDNVCLPGNCSLREAINAANDQSDSNTITFNIPAADPRHYYYQNDNVAGQVTLASATTTAETNDTNILDIDPDWPHSWWSIRAQNQLPHLQDFITIDGYSQPGSSVNTQSVSDDAVIRIEVSGIDLGASVDGLTIDGDTGECEIKGLVINSFALSGIALSGGSYNAVAGNFIGTDVSGTLALANVEAGVAINGSSNNLIGCTVVEERNIISGNTGEGVAIEFSSGNFVQGNFIGVAANGTTLRGNGASGVEVSNGASNNTIGVEAQASQNLSNLGAAKANNKTLSALSRFACHSSSPTAAVKSKLEGSALLSPSDTAIAGANTIVGNGGDGVKVTSSGDLYNRISENSIYLNGGLGINLVSPVEGAGGVTDNDPGDADLGPNGLQNFPVITSVDVATQTISGTLNTVPDTSDYVIEFFASPAGSCDPSTRGEGKTFIGSITTGLTDSGTGDVAFTFTAPASSFADGDIITASATDSSGNTSEFSACSCATPATPTASNNGPYCEGATIQLSTPTLAGATYAWTGPNGFTSSQQNPTRANATTADAGTYSVTVTVNGCPSAAGTTNVTVNATPATPTASNTGPYCEGATIQLSTATVAGASYAWTGPNGFTSSQQNPTRASATTADAGTYSVSVTVNGCPSAAGTTNVVVNATPATPTASNTGPYCEGATIQLSTATVAGASYAWTGPNGFTSSQQNPTRASATTADAGTYSVSVTVNGCPSAAGTTNVTVNATPATPTASNTGPYCEGATIQLSTATVAGASYAWTGPNGFTSSQQNPTRANATTADAGTYSVSVTVNGCPSAAGTTNVTVNATPATPTASNTGSYCEGSTIQLSTPTVAGATYAWTGPNGFASSQQNPTRASATTADAGTYSVSVTVNGCPSAAGTTNVTVNATPATPTASNSGPYCEGATIQLSTPTVAGATYAWTGPNGFASSQQNPTRASATTADAGTYSVSVTVNGCPSAAGTTNVVVNATPATPTASNSGPYCEGATIQLSTATVAGATYAWTGPNGFTSSQQNPTRASATTADAGTYSVTLTVNGCPSAAGTTNVVVNATPATPTASNSGPYSEGATIQLSTPTVAGATYAWTGPNGFASSQQNPTRANSTTADAGSYSVTVTVNGCPSAAGTTNVEVGSCPTNFTVNDSGDTGDAAPGDSLCKDGNNKCTLRAAIEEANALASCGTININFAIGSNAIDIGTPLTIDHNLNITGPTADSVRINGNSLTRLFTVNLSRTTSISNLTLSGGNGSGGDGGAVQNNGTLTLNAVTLSGNSAVNGGAIRSDGALVLTNTTISGNNASDSGGGLYHAVGQATLTNVTIAYNRSDNDNNASGAGGGVFRAGGNVLLHNTIVADNYQGSSPSTTADNIGGTVDLSSSYNVIGTGAGGLTNGANNNQVGVASALLGALINNGGPTFTHGLLYNSPAVDSGDGAVVNSPLFVNVDQRGLSRPADGDLTPGAQVDIGAYERQVTETRPVRDGSGVPVNINDARVTFPCVPAGGCGAGANREAGQSRKGIAPLIEQPSLSISDVDPATQPAPPSGFVIGNNSSPPLPAFDVSTSATYDAPVTICFYLPSITDGTFFSGLRVFHNNGSSLDLLTGQATDFANKLVCGQVNSFSTFVIGHTAPPPATNGTVSGQIVDTNGNPVEGAAVRLNGTQNRLTITDTEGKYHFDEVETNGSYVITPSRSNFTFSPSQRSFNQIGAHTDAPFTGSPTAAGLNPLDATEYFVRQQYLDFLGREPDEAGFNFWVNNIESCGSDVGCREVRRIDTSAAFFLSIEFQQTGYVVYRTYQAAYGDLPNAPVPLQLTEFRSDAAQISKGVVVLQSGWEQTLENNKKLYAEVFVKRARFASAYPLTMTPTEFVDKLFANAGLSLADDDHAAAIAEFNQKTDTSDIAARVRALRRVADNATLVKQRFNRAFVLMEYFGYLRRDPNSGQDRDFAGYNFWLDKLDRFNGNFRAAEMVKAFLSSIEYRARFPQ